MLIGIFSDAHGHIDAFRLARDVLREHGASKLYFLGDAVGYIPSADVVRELRESREIQPLLGNHEAMLLSGKFGDSRQAEVYRLDSVHHRLGQDDMAFLRSWPVSYSMDIDARRLLFVHGSPNEPTYGYVYPDSALDAYAEVPADVIFMGHTHHPFVRSEFGRLFVNVGSCGLPRDATPLGCAALFDTASGEATLLRFPIAESSEALLAAGGLSKPVAKHLQRYASYKEGS